MRKIVHRLGIIGIIGIIGILPFSAHATPCTETPFYDGFSGQFFNTSTVTGFMWGLDEQYMYVILTNGKISGFINVPQSTAQNFNYSQQPDNFYATQILNIYRRPLMTETCQNILLENGQYLLIQ